VRRAAGKVGIGMLLVFPLAEFAPRSCVCPGAATHARSAHHHSQAKDQDIHTLLQRWSGGAISRLPESDCKAFQSFVIKRLVTQDGSSSFPLMPNMVTGSGRDAYVWSFPTIHSDWYLILLNINPGPVPCAEHAWIFLVDTNGAFLRHQDFDIGWRMGAKTASFGPSPWVSSNVLVQETRAVITSSPPLKISIAFDWLRPATVRVETLDGSLQKMPYWAPNFVVGPTYDPPTLASLEHILQSGTDVQQLEALTWL